MNRREFLAVPLASAACAVSAEAVATTGPTLLGVTRKADEKNPVIGTGEHKYECHHNWGALPKDIKWQTTHNVALDSQGHVYITHQGLGNNAIDTVFVFDPAGKFVRSFGRDWHGGGHGIEIRKEGAEEFIYLTNTWHQFNKLVKTNLKGEVVWVKGRPECKEYEYRVNPKDKTRVAWPAYNPTNVTFLPDGGFNVGDGYGSNYLLNYDKDAKLVKVFGGTGTGDGQLQTPHGQWYDDRVKNHPTLVVCDRANARLCRFTPDGKFIDATKKEQTVLFPAHAKTRGDVLLVPDLHARVSLFDKDLKPIVHLGEDAEWRKRVVDSLSKGPAVRSDEKQWKAGKFVHPHDAAFDKDGNIFVVEWVQTGRVTLLKKVA